MDKGNMTEIRVSRWWMGGVASAAAACFTQPLDTIKVSRSNCVEMNGNYTDGRLRVCKAVAV
jgi:hypothetical protein